MSESIPGTTMQRPYLLRAMHEWMTDNALTPHIVIDVAESDHALPVEHAKDGKLIINVSYSATENLLIDNQHASFDARFSGVSRHLDVPISAIIGIYARETGQGMIFSSERPDADAQSVKPVDADEGSTGDDDTDGNGDPPPPPSGRPHLKVVK